MSLWDKLTGELVDIVESPEGTAEDLVVRFARYQNEIKYGAQLVVREGQGAIFVNEGKLADTFTPGTYQLETRNLPVLSTLRGWKYGFNSPFKAEVYFFNTKPLLNQQWGTQQPITLQVEGYGLVELRAFGQAAYRIADPVVFFRQLVGTVGLLTGRILLDYIRGIIVARFTELLAQSHPKIEDLATNLGVLNASVLQGINTVLQPLGLEATQFQIESISLPPKLRDELFEYSRLQNVDIARFTQFQTAKSLTNLGSGDGGGVGAQSMQIGVGLAAAQQIGQVMNTSFAKAAGSTEPPPIPGEAAFVSYHVAIDGKAAGPFSLDQLRAHIVNGTLNGSSPVWKPGMAKWAAAETQSQLQALFSKEPPPLP